jgi:hypothetical protein
MKIGASLLAGAMLLAIPALPASAHDEYDRHARDPARHGNFHYDVGRAHQPAHEEGFYSRSEHRAYHRALRGLHREFHEDHPGTRHDHYSWRRY